MDGVVDEALGVGVAVVERAERIEAGCEGVAHEGIPGLEIDQVAACAAFVALPPFLDVTHRAVARQIGAGQQGRTPLLFQQVGEGEDRRVVVMRVAPHDHRIDPFDGRRHDVGAAGELAAAPVDGLMHGAALEEVVALVGAAAGVEEGEHAGDQQRRLVVRDGVGACEDRNRFAVLAVRVGEEERIGGGVAAVEDAAFAYEAAFDERTVVDERMLGRDEVVGLDVDADARKVADRAVGEDGDPFERRPVADTYVAQQPAVGDAAVAADASLRGACRVGRPPRHTVECGDERRTVAVDGGHVGDLGGQAAVNPYRAAAVLVHDGHLRAVSESAFAAAFQADDLFDERPCADVVVADTGVADAHARCEPDTAAQPRAAQLRGVKVLRHLDRRPVVGRRAGGFERGDFAGGQSSVCVHSRHISNLQI